MIKSNILSYFVRNITNSKEKKLYTQELIYNCVYIKYKGTDILYMYDFFSQYIYNYNTNILRSHNGKFMSNPKIKLKNYFISKIILFMQML
jgi:hypothetical protein